jgi:hypothetical protein
MNARRRLGKPKTRKEKRESAGKRATMLRAWPKRPWFHGAQGIHGDTHVPPAPFKRAQKPVEPQRAVEMRTGVEVLNGATFKERRHA